MARALGAWRRVNPSRATFRALVEIAIGLRRGDTATDICTFIVKELNGKLSDEHRIWLDNGEGSGEYIHAVVNKIENNFCSPGDMRTKMDQQQQSGKSMAYI